MIKKYFFALESENATISLDVNKSINVEINNQLNQIEDLKSLEKHSKAIKPTLDDYQQSLQITESITQDQTVQLKQKEEKLESAKGDLINYNSIQIGINDSFLLENVYQKTELVTQNVKTDFIQAVAKEVNEIIVSDDTKELKTQKHQEFKAEKELILQKSTNISQTLINSKENTFTEESIRKETIEPLFLEHSSVDCKQNTSLVFEKQLLAKKKPKKLTAIKNLETTQNLLIVEQVEANESKTEHKIKKKKTSVAMPRISTKEAIIISSIETSLKEDNLSQEKIILDQAKPKLKPQKAIQITNPFQLDLEIERKHELTICENAQPNLCQLQNAFEVSEIVLDSNLNKIIIDSVEHKEAQIDLLENKVHSNLDQIALEKEKELKIIKELNQQASKQIIALQPLRIDQNKKLENTSELEIKKKKKVKAKRDLSECRLESINVTSSVFDDKEKEFRLETKDKQQANISLISKRTSSLTEICALENEMSYQEAKLDLNVASTSLDFRKPLEVEIVLANETNEKFESQLIIKKQPELIQDALNLATADSVCMESKFLRSQITGKSLENFNAL